MDKKVFITSLIKDGGGLTGGGGATGAAVEQTGPDFVSNWPPAMPYILYPREGFPDLFFLAILYL